jgi:hypothetical protein
MGAPQKFVIPLKKGIHAFYSHLKTLDSRLRGNDFIWGAPQKFVIPLKKGIHAFYSHLKTLDLPLRAQARLPMLGTRSRE